MISWINGVIVDLWQTNNKFFILINCHGLGYEIQVLESIFISLKTEQIPTNNIILWLKHIKKEDSDTLYGFNSKDQRDFFIQILNIKGVGSQIGMSLLNKFSINEIFNAVNNEDKNLINSVQGIGPKMSERIILELKSNFSSESKVPLKKEIFHVSNIKINSILEDLDLTLQSLNYPKKEIKNLFPILIEDISNFTQGIEGTSFEDLLKLSMDYLDKNNSNLDQ